MSSPLAHPRAPCTTPVLCTPAQSSPPSPILAPRSLFNVDRATPLSDPPSPRTPRDGGFHPLSLDTPSTAAIPSTVPLTGVRFDESKNNHSDGAAWHSSEQSEDYDKGGFHLRNYSGKPLSLDEGKVDEHDSPVTSSVKHPYSPSSRSLTSENSTSTKDTTPDKLLNVSGLTPEAQRLLHLLCCMYRCRECLPTPRDRDEQHLGIDTQDYNSRALCEHCCMGHALSQSWPSMLPYDLISLTQSYTLTQPSRAFLTRPAPASAGVIQCFILKNNNRFELYMEMRDHQPFADLKKELEDTSVIDEEIRARLFKDRRMGLTKKKFTTVDRESHENNTKTMLIEHAKSLIDSKDDILLMTAQRRRAWTGNSYTIMMGNGDAQSQSTSSKSQSSSDSNANFLGKLKSNFGGTEFVLTEVGVRKGVSSGKHGKAYSSHTHSNNSKSVSPLNLSPSHSQSHTVPGVRYSREAGVILYDHFFEHTGSPIRIKVALPNRSFHASDTGSHSNSVSGGVSRQWKLETKEQLEKNGADGDNDHDNANNPQQQQQQRPIDSKLSKIPVTSQTLDEFDEFSFQTPTQQIEQFENLRPVWHDGMNAYVLHFDHHRVREKSVKNFKLVRANDGEKRTILQFGRVLDRNVFVMDFAWPLSPFQAFSICLSSIDPKIAV